jgi:hypothetical protein
MLWALFLENKQETLVIKNVMSFVQMVSVAFVNTWVSKMVFVWRYGKT